MIEPTYALKLLMEVVEDDPVMDVVKVQPPDGCVLRDINGKTYGVSIYRLED